MSGQQRGAPTSEQVDLVTLTRETIADFNAVVGEHTGIRLAALEHLTVQVDREAMRQILMNLLDNAWKYGGAPPEILVAISSSAAEISIVIADRGPGIPPAERSRIWEPYVRLDRERSSSIAGTGIGLAVVRDLVHSCGGRCWVEENPGGGARFIVALPGPPHSVE
jgi:signal transduction histidine kinase